MKIVALCVITSIANEIANVYDYQVLKLSLTHFFLLIINLSYVSCRLSAARQPRVAVVREEGSNGDREMSVSLYMAGFEVGIRYNYLYQLGICLPKLYS